MKSATPLPCAIRATGVSPPLGGVLARETEAIAVPALGDLLIADGQGNVIQALRPKTHA